MAPLAANNVDAMRPATISRREQKSFIGNSSCALTLLCPAPVNMSAKLAPLHIVMAQVCALPHSGSGQMRNQKQFD
ncbi:MAG: hypothetical protein ACJARR_000174 [Pseudophaeobacter arcticus]|jgi:hypothetical protein